MDILIIIYILGAVITFVTVFTIDAIESKKKNSIFMAGFAPYRADFVAAIGAAALFPLFWTVCIITIIVDLIKQ